MKKGKRIGSLAISYMDKPQENMVLELNSIFTPVIKNKQKILSKISSKRSKNIQNVGQIFHP